jgi:hypothetical protein
MSVQTVQQRVRAEVDSLPEPLAAEVFDFVEFLKARRAEEAFLWQQVGETRRYREQHPEEVLTVTTEEWEQITAHLEPEP